ncbi:hypothetical protein [Nocardiopsis flavescens]
MRRRFTRGAAVLAACSVLVCTSCQSYNEYFVVENGLDVPAIVQRSDSPEAFAPEPGGFDWGVQPGEAWFQGLLESERRPWYRRVWPFREWAPRVCRDDIYLHVHSEDGRTWTREPPLCSGGVWLIDG